MATVAQLREAGFVGRFDDQMSAGAASAERAMKNLGATVVETDQAVTRSTRTSESWLRSADPMTAAANRAAAAQRNLSTATKALAADVAAGGEKQAAAERALQVLSERAKRAKSDLDALESGSASASSAISGVGNSARLTARELQQLSPQIADVGVTLAGGMPPFLVLIQQGPQIVEAVGGIGRAFRLLGAAATSPAAGVIAAGAAMAGFMIVAESQSRALNDLSNRLRITRDDYESLAVTTESSARRIAATTSLSTGDARTSGRIIASSRNFKGNEAELTNLIALSGRLATAMGTDAATAAGKLAEALDRPRQAAEALANSGLRTMNEGLVRQITLLDAQGRTAEAARLTIDAYNRAIGEVAKTPLQRATEELSNAFTRLWQGLQPAVVGIGTGTLKFFADLADVTARLVNGIAQLGAGLRDSSVARYLFGAPATPATAPSASGQTSLELQLQRAREANPRFRQQEINRAEAGAVREVLPGASGDDARLLRSRLQELNEAYRGMQGPVADYLKGLREQAELSGIADGAARELAQAERGAAEAGGDAAAQAQARALVQRRLTNEFVNFIAVQNQASISTKAQADAMQGGATAVDNVRIAHEAEVQALRYAKVGTEEYALIVQILTGQITQQRDAQQSLNASRSISTQEQQLAIIQRETELVGAGVVVRERELAILRERQRILNEPGADINSEESQTRLANAGQIAEATQALQRQQSAFSELQRVGEQAFDRIGSAITTAFANGSAQSIKFGTIAKAVISEIIQAMLRLAVINPLKNALMGANSPTLSFGGMFGGGQAQAAQPGGGGGLGDAGSSFGTLRTAYNGLTSPGGLGPMFPGGSSFNTGFSGVDSALNTNVFQGAFPSEAGFQAIVDGTGATTGASIGQLLGPGLAVAGGAYGVYSGLQRGGVGGYTSAAGGAVSAATGLAMLGSAAGLLPALGVLGPIGLGIGAVLAIAGALMPGAKPSGQGQLARSNLNTGEMSYEGLGGKRFSQANRDAATSAVEGIAALAREVGDKLGGARIGGNVAVGVTNGTLYLDVNGQTAQFGNDEAGAKALSEKAAELVLAQFATQGTVQGDYRKILDATGGGGIEGLSQNLQFYEQVYKPMIDSAPELSAFERSIQALRDQFDPAIGKANELGLAIEAMTAARDKEIAKAIEQRDVQFAGLSASVVSRGIAAGAFGGDRGALIFSSSMSAATRNAATELEDLKNQLEALGASSETTATLIQQLTDTQQAEAKKLIELRDAQVYDFRVGLAIRNARASGDLGSADLLEFDQAAKKEIADARTSLENLGVSAADVANDIVRLEQTQAIERLNIIKTYGQQSVEEQQRIAEAQLNSARTILDYLNNQALGSSSSLSPTQRLAEAERQFNEALGSGDASRLTSAADALLTNSQAVFGGATETYAQREASVRRVLINQGTSALDGGGDSATVTALSQMTIVLKDELAMLRASFDALLNEQRRTNDQKLVA